MIKQDQYIQLGSLRARYWMAGNEGAPVIFIHGIGGFVENWELTMPALFGRRREFAVDLPGHGQTDKPRDYPYHVSAFSRFIQDFAAALGLGQVSLVGHSMGGGIALRVALEAPALVDRLVLVGAGGLGPGLARALRILTLPGLGERLTRPLRSGVRSALAVTVYDPAGITDKWIDLDYRYASLPGTQRAFLRTLRAGCTFFGQKASVYGPHLRGLRGWARPVQVIWGQQDNIVPAAHAEVAARLFADARVHLFDRCGHIPMLEHPEKFNQLLADFLQ